MMLLFY